MSVASAHPWLILTKSFQRKSPAVSECGSERSYTAVGTGDLGDKRDARSKDQPPLDKQQSVMLTLLSSVQTPSQEHRNPAGFHQIH